MSDFRNEEEYERDLEDDYNLSRSAESDDFANFDPSRYLRRRRPAESSMDADPEEADLNQRREADPRSAFENFDPNAYIRQRAPRPPVNVPSERKGCRNLNVLDLVQMLMDRGARTYFLGIGCLMVAVFGCGCGVILWLLGVLRG